MERGKKGFAVQFSGCTALFRFAKMARFGLIAGA
jgi:hypothetical protein